METKANKKKLSRDSILIFFLKNRALLLVLVFSTLLTLTTRTFATSGNLMSLARQIAANGIIGVGYTFLLASDSVDLSAGYPYTLGVTMENLLEAAKGENEEAARAYPAFARTAREEGYADAAALWENIARIEAMHRDVFLESYNQMQTERLYRKERPIVWRCLNCGFVLLAKEAFRVCPVCGKDRGWAEGDIETRRLGKEG